MKKILIANRGEIAIRIIKACKELNIQTVAVYSEADKESLHIMLADESYQIGKAQPAESYLHMNNIIELAKLTRCDAIHPGYGFLAENIMFRKLCEKEQIKFIGPSLENLICMGDKLKAKEIAKRIDIPVVPGIDDLIKSSKELENIVEKTGFPIILKSSSGGGGKGIKVCYTKKEAIKQFSIIKNETKLSFGEDGVYLEKYIPKFKHIEVQILSDMYGNCIHLGERICSIQRNMQKLIEESPAPLLPPKLREEMCQAAVRLGKEIKYVGLGTVEFIYDYENEKYYFMEMNTRIQVEHPVTEMIYNIDLVKEQIKVAREERLELTQDDVNYHGSAIECRINAENPDMHFSPSVGEIELFIPPYGSPNIRVDTFIYSGYKVLPYYDSMLGKVIVLGENRMDAIRKMKVALSTTKIEGVHTTISFLQKLIMEDKFIDGSYDNLFVEEFMHK